MDRQCNKVACDIYRSGVLLDYTPEDTLKSLIMEKHLVLEKNLDRFEIEKFDANSLTPGHSEFSEKMTKITTESEICGKKPHVSIKRPFLRKNQGRAAWCSRLYRNECKVADTPKASASVASCSNDLSRKSVAALKSCVNPRKVTLELSEESSQDNFISTTVHRKDVDVLVCNESSQMNNKENRSYVSGTSNFPLGSTKSNADNELEEFEMLERLTASPHCDTSEPIKSIQEAAHQSLLPNNCYLSPGKFYANSPDVLESSSSSGSLSHESVKSATPNRNGSNFGSLRKPLKTPKLHRSDQLPITEAASLQLNGSEAWPDATTRGICAESKNFESQMCPPLSSVRFILPEPNEGLSGSANVNSKSSTSESPSSTTSLIKTWITRLEAEVSRFNSENARLQRMKSEREEAMKVLEKDRKEFDEYKESTMKAFEAFRQAELDKIKKERKVLVDYQKSLHLMPQKRDRKEIERLKQQLSDEKTEAAQRELRLQHQVNRQRLRIEELIAEKSELFERIKRLEHTRLALQSELAEDHANHVLRGSCKLHGKFRSKNLNSISQAVTFGSFKSNSKGVIPAADTASTGPKESISNCQDSQATNMIDDTSGNPSKTPPFRIPPTKRDSTAHISLRASEESLSPDSNPTTFHRIREPTIREIRHPDSSVERLDSDASKKITADGVSSAVYLLSGDSRHALANGAVVYRHGYDDTMQTTNPDGTGEVLYRGGNRTLNYPSSVSSETGFSHSQIQQVPFPSINLSTRPPDSPGPSTEKPTINEPVVVEESSLPDGMIVKLFSNGDKTISLPNGQREVHCAEFKRRIYPDGTVKTVFSSGRQETRYASGRVRLKDRDGNLLLDTRMAPLSQTAVSGLATLDMPSHLITW